ncbi:hypothetical protein ACFQZE_24125 [Paenibacillus sp. GCM10027627]
MELSSKEDVCAVGALSVHDREWERRNMRFEIDAMLEIQYKMKSSDLNHTFIRALL